MYNALAIERNRPLMVMMESKPIINDIELVAEESVLEGIKLEPGELEGTWWFLAKNFCSFGVFVG